MRGAAIPARFPAVAFPVAGAYMLRVATAARSPQ